MATKQAYTAKSRIYNGTHGNLSIQAGKIDKFVSTKNEKLELFRLGVGVRLIQAKLFVKDAFTAGTLKVSLIDAKDDRVISEVIATGDLTKTGVIDSDGSVYFPALPDHQGDTIVVVESTAAATGNKSLAFEIYTQSVGNA